MRGCLARCVFGSLLTDSPKARHVEDFERTSQQIICKPLRWAVKVCQEGLTAVG